MGSQVEVARVEPRENPLLAPSTIQVKIEPGEDPVLVATTIQHHYVTQNGTKYTTVHEVRHDVRGDGARFDGMLPVRDGSFDISEQTTDEECVGESADEDVVGIVQALADTKHDSDVDIEEHDSDFDNEEHDSDFDSEEQDSDFDSEEQEALQFMEDAARLDASDDVDGELTTL